MKTLRLNSGSVRRLLRGALAGLGTAAIGLALTFTPLGATFERAFGLDWLFKIRGGRLPPGNVVVVNINNETGSALGLARLPHHWPRTVHARLVDELVRRNVEGIVFAIDFSRARKDEEDAILARAFAEADRVVLFEWLSSRRQPLTTASGNRGGWAWYEERRPPTAALAAAAKGFGPFPLPKLDESAFEFWAFKPSAGNAPTSAAIALQLRALAVYDTWRSVLKTARLPETIDLPNNAREFRSPSDMSRLMVQLRKAFHDDRQFRQRVMQTVEHASEEERRMLTALVNLYSGPDHYHLNFFGPPGTIRTVPYEAFLGRNLKPRAASEVDLTGQMVFVGYSDLYDPNQPGFFTSFTSESGVDLSGVEMMATAYSNLLNGRFIRPSSPIGSASAVVFFGLVVGILAYLLPATVSVPVVLAFATGYAAFAQWRFNTSDLWLPLATPLLVQLPLAILLGLMGQYLIERRKEKFARETFGRYLSDEVVTTLLGSPSGAAVDGEERLITMLMTDLRGFTLMTERLPPKQVYILLNRYLTKMVAIPKQHGGIVDEIIGDAIFVLFGALDQREDDAERAVACAVDMQLAMAAINEQNLADDLPELEMGIAVHTGEIVVGNIGSEERLKYGVVGNNVNLTSRIQSCSVGGQILISDATRQHVKSVLKLGKHMEISAKGLECPLNLHEVLGIGGRYRRYLPDCDDALVPLAEEVRVKCRIVEGHQVNGSPYDGTLTKIGSKTAEVRLERSVPNLSNLKLHLVSADGSEIGGCIYAKVVAIVSIQDCCFLIRFTALSNAETFFCDLRNIDETFHRSEVSG